jgi:transcriptional regulator with XRE-family HTH domain
LLGGDGLKNRIKEIRKSLGLTQEEFSKRLGIKRNTVANYEIGRNEPIDAVISLICREFDVNEEWLRCGTGEMFIERLEEDETAALVQNLLDTSNPFYDSILSIMKMYDKLNDNSQKVVDDFFKSIVDDLQNKKED